MQTRRSFLSLALAPAFREVPFDWSAIPAGKWLRIPANGVAAPKVFHGGATLDPERGEIYFFGSDTHWPTALEKGESNAVWRLDYVTMTWSQDYEQDPKSTYRILGDGQTETTTGRPWAFHTFAAVKWDPTVKRMMAVSYPEHTRFDPKKRFPMFKGDWYKHLKPMHWEYDPVSKRWTRMETDPPNLFAQAMVWDPDHKQMIGHNGSKTYHFDRAKGRWITYDAATVPGGYHRTLVWDSFAHRVLLLGNNLSSNVLWSYDPEQHKWDQVPAKGWCLPANGSTIAYDSQRKQMLYLANDHPNQYSNPTGKSVTFVYDSEDRYWTRLEGPSPELYGMNYLTQYIPGHRAFLHFEKSKDSGEHIVIHGFRLP
ncbi:MAG: hypothetical protein NTY38_18875 [Acidobacteria bacterium]|nr:hypothetical protein [Acidobacteriota bacterium]